MSEVNIKYVYLIGGRDSGLLGYTTDKELLAIYLSEHPNLTCKKISYKEYTDYCDANRMGYNNLSNELVWTYGGHVMFIDDEAVMVESLDSYSTEFEYHTQWLKDNMKFIKLNNEELSDISYMLDELYKFITRYYNDYPRDDDDYSEDLYDIYEAEEWYIKHGGVAEK